MPSGVMLAGSIPGLLLSFSMAMSTAACISHVVYKDFTSKEQ